MADTESAGSWIKARRTEDGGLRVAWHFDPSGSSALVGGRLLEKAGALDTLVGAGNALPERMGGFWPDSNYAGEASLETDDEGVVYRLLETSKISVG